ncbi:uncharacterized protein LOC117104581 [Anneissia japonica]|uniref:uncharacterized protein LOC117104581 n=1 Tax=Anneissia japonica TaxID=1529436 RepID=UPI00142565D4|nr:uncharacterized protein LOC117104581 [Anneissia japonica]
MENVRLPHCNLSHTAKILCLINNGFLNFMIGMTYVTLGVLNAVIADSIGSTDGYITFVAGISIAITNFSAVAIGLTCSTNVSVLGLIFGDHLSNAIGFVTLLLMIGTATPPATQIFE